MHMIALNHLVMKHNGIILLDVASMAQWETKNLDYPSNAGANLIRQRGNSNQVITG